MRFNDVKSACSIEFSDIYQYCHVFFFFIFGFYICQISLCLYYLIYKDRFQRTISTENNLSQATNKCQNLLRNCEDYNVIFQ